MCTECGLPGACFRQYGRPGVNVTTRTANPSVTRCVTFWHCGRWWHVWNAVRVNVRGWYCSWPVDLMTWLHLLGPM